MAKPVSQKSAHIHRVPDTQICLNFSSRFHFFLWKAVLEDFSFLLDFIENMKISWISTPKKSLSLKLLSVHDILLRQ